MTLTQIFVLMFFFCAEHGLSSRINILSRDVMQQIRNSAGNQQTEQNTFIKHFSEISRPNVDSKMKSLQNLFSTFLIRDTHMQKFPKWNADLTVPFSWKPCTSAKQIMEIVSLSVTPSPVHFPGKIKLSFEVIFNETISEDENVTIALDVSLDTRHIPCFGQIGSCTYTDFCQLTASNQCPKEFSDKGIPCRCPFNKGKYQLLNFPITIDAEVLVPGDYKVTMKVSSDMKGAVACYTVYFTED